MSSPRAEHQVVQSADVAGSACVAWCKQSGRQGERCRPSEQAFPSHFASARKAHPFSAPRSAAVLVLVLLPSCSAPPLHPAYLRPSAHVPLLLTSPAGLRRRPVRRSYAVLRQERGGDGSTAGRGGPAAGSAWYQSCEPAEVEVTETGPPIS